MTAPGGIQQQRNGLGTAGFVLGLLAAIFAWIPFIGVIAWPLAILGLIFSAIGLWRVQRRRADNRGLTIAGLILSIIALIFCIIYASAFAGAVNDLNEQGVPAPAAAAPGGAATGQSSVQAGDTVNVGGVELSTSQLTVEERQYMPIQLCTTASYRNTGDTTTDYNSFDWKLQTPNGQILSPGIAFGSDPGEALNSGQLAPSGTAEGVVCWDAPTAAGTYTVLYQSSMLASGPQASWITTR